MVRPGTSLPWCAVLIPILLCKPLLQFELQLKQIEVAPRVPLAEEYIDSQRPEITARVSDTQVPIGA